jgi:hypothetical protein
VRAPLGRFCLFALGQETLILRHQGDSLVGIEYRNIRLIALFGLHGSLVVAATFITTIVLVTFQQSIEGTEFGQIINKP